MGSTAVAIYEKLITQDKVDAILGPYSSPLTEAVADVPERHRMAMVAAGMPFTRTRAFEETVVTCPPCGHIAVAPTW